MRANRGPRFAAVLTPTGVHAICYRRRRRALEIVRYRGEIAAHATIGTAARALTELLEAEGARKGRLSLAIAGFGSCHHLLSLPPASADLLEPIVRREVKRFFPDIFAEDEPPYIAFTSTGVESARAAETPMRDLLVAAIPRDVVYELRSALAQSEIALEHLTVIPAGLGRLFEAFVGTTETSGLALVTPNYSTVAFFHEGGLRLFTEPSAILREGSVDTANALADQIERGSLYLRQQFRGTRLRTVHLAAPDQDRPRIITAVQEVEEAALRPFVPGETPGALLCLGVALDAEADGRLNLLPPEMRPPTQTERWVRSLGVAACAVLILAASWWALMGVRAEATAAERLRVHQESLVPRAAAYARIDPVVRERQAHVLRAELLRRMVSERQRIPELLWPLQDAASFVAVDDLTLTRDPEGWSGRLAATARSWSSSDASVIVDGVYQGLIRDLPAGSVSLDGLWPGEPAGGEQIGPGVSVRFGISFIVPLSEWEVE